MEQLEREPVIAVVGLGYVGLPVALAFARRFPGTLGFDVSRRRVAELSEGEDTNGEVPRAALLEAGLRVTADPHDLRAADFFVVAVPTPIDAQRRPDLGPVRAAARTVGEALSPGDVVVFESTGYPGLTEEVCAPLLCEASGLVRGEFGLGYSPERINPGDAEHSFERNVKVVAGEDQAVLDRVAEVYAEVVPAGIHRAPSIAVAEAAKVIENAQRDLNIALMNECALIFDRLGLRTADVLAAAATKWNFAPFTPGLVGGHCIGVDPYYLTAKAEAAGYTPEVILAGRRINDGMGAFVGRKVAELLARRGVRLAGARVGVLGLTFKPDVSDLRNSGVPGILSELESFGVRPIVHDPLASAEEARRLYEVELVPLAELTEVEAVILAVPHRELRERPPAELLHGLGPNGLVADVTSALDPRTIAHEYWSL